MFSDNNVKTNCINKIHYIEYPEFNNDSDFSDCSEYYNYNMSNIKFMSVSIDYNNNSYPIELKTDNYNYYMVNNVLNKSFFQYYLCNVLNISVDMNDPVFNYYVNIIDHNVNIVGLTPEQSLIIKENEYEIKNNMDQTSETEQLEQAEQTCETEPSEQSDPTSETCETCETDKTNESDDSDKSYETV